MFTILADNVATLYRRLSHEIMTCLVIRGSKQQFSHLGRQELLEAGGVLEQKMMMMSISIHYYYYYYIYIIIIVLLLYI